MKTVTVYKGVDVQHAYEAIAKAADVHIDVVKNHIHFTTHGRRDGIGDHFAIASSSYHSRARRVILTSTRRPASYHNKAIGFYKITEDEAKRAARLVADALERNREARERQRKADEQMERRRVLTVNLGKKVIAKYGKKAFLPSEIGTVSYSLPSSHREGEISIKFDFEDSDRLFEVFERLGVREQ